jgi:large subunit ribosomal protein L6
MSKLAKKPILLPNGVEVKVDGIKVTIKGPKGQLSHELCEGINVEIADKSMVVSKSDNIHKNGSFHGLHWALLRNKVNGCGLGFTKVLTLIGVGYRANVQGNKLDLQIGQSHPLKLDIPQELTVAIEKGTKITITGADKQKVGQFAATVRATNPPEPYKGKGIREEGEYVRKKAGKSAKTGK